MDIKIKQNERIDDLNIEGLKVIQNTEYFLFGMDSVLLANMVKSNSINNVIVDLCTGSAVIPILLSHKVKSSKIIGVELQQEMYDLAIRNVKLNSLKDKIEILNKDVVDYKNLRKETISITGKENVDIVVCNPPYKKKGTGSESEGDVRYIARHEEKCTLKDIFVTSSKLLKSKGKLYLVHKPERLADLITMAREYNLELKSIRFMQPKLSVRASIVLLEYAKDGGEEAKVEPVLIEYDKYGNYTSEIKEIYEIDGGKLGE